MKIITIIARLRTRRARKVEWIEIGRDWSVRDWADLPTHHPRKD